MEADFLRTEQPHPLPGIHPGFGKLLIQAESAIKGIQNPPLDAVEVGDLARTCGRLFEKTLQTFEEETKQVHQHHLATYNSKVLLEVLKILGVKLAVGRQLDPACFFTQVLRPKETADELHVRVGRFLFNCLPLIGIDSERYKNNDEALLRSLENHNIALLIHNWKPTSLPSQFTKNDLSLTKAIKQIKVPNGNPTGNGIQSNYQLGRGDRSLLG